MHYEKHTVFDPRFLRLLKSHKIHIGRDKKSKIYTRLDQNNTRFHAVILTFKKHSDCIYDEYNAFGIDDIKNLYKGWSLRFSNTDARIVYLRSIDQYTIPVPRINLVKQVLTCRDCRECFTYNTSNAIAFCHVLDCEIADPRNQTCRFHSKGDNNV